MSLGYASRRRKVRSKMTPFFTMFEVKTESLLKSSAAALNQPFAAQSPQTTHTTQFVNARPGGVARRGGLVAALTLALPRTEKRQGQGQGQGKQRCGAASGAAGGARWAPAPRHAPDKGVPM